MKLFSCSSCANVLVSDSYRLCCWRITAGNVIHTFSIKDVFLPPYPPVIDQDYALYDSSHLIHRLRALLLLLSGWWDRWLSAGQRVQQPRITSLSFSGDEWHLALRGNGRRHLDWFDLCSAQNTHATNSESEFAPCAILCARIII